jgi:hypothetical protein
MALSLSTSISTEDCQNLIFTETTGTYNVTTNPTGWGSPNPATSTAAGAVVTVLVPSGTSYTFSVFASSFPTVTSTQQYLINYEDLGMSDGLVDGLYTITYVVPTLQIILGVPTVITYTTILNTMIVCNLECCIDTLLLEIDDWTCDCSKDAKENFLTAHAIFEQIQHSIECGDLDTAGDLVDMAGKICRNENCSTCK